MRVVIQRVLEARVEVNGEEAGRIGKGLLVYLSVAPQDTQKDAEFIAEKLVGLRIFPDKMGKMNLSLLDTQGGILLVSNFTLHGDCRKGRRPGFDSAAEPAIARQLYELTAQLTAGHGITVAKGVFGEHMHVTSVNDGPATFLLDSCRLF